MRYSIDKQTKICYNISQYGNLHAVKSTKIHMKEN